MTIASTPVRRCRFERFPRIRAAANGRGACRWLPRQRVEPQTPAPTLFTAFRPLDGSGYRELYAGSVAGPRATRLYRNTGWDIVAMATGDFEPNLHDTLLTAFEWPSRTQIHGGNGTSSVTGLGIYHRFDTVQP